MTAVKDSSLDAVDGLRDVEKVRSVKASLLKTRGP